MQSDPRARFLDIVLGNETILVLTDRLAEIELRTPTSPRVASVRLSGTM